MVLGRCSKYNLISILIVKIDGLGEVLFIINQMGYLNGKQGKKGL